MKKTFLIITACLCFFTSITKAQVKDQSEQLKTIKKGKYTAYLTHKEGDKYKGGISDRDYVIKEIKTYRIRPNSNHSEVYFIASGNPDRKDEQKAWMYLPDNEAFPVTYASRGYEGNKKMQEEIGYVYTVPKSKYYEDDRIVFLDGKIYILNDWKNKDSYKLKAVLEFEEKPIKGLKLMKVVMKSPKKMEVEKPEVVLQKYLDEATVKQKQVYANWIAKPANKNFETNQAAKTDLMVKTIRQKSKEWRNSAEFKRIQANNSMADESRKRSEVTIKNNSGNRIIVAEDGGHMTRISSGSSDAVSCDRDIYYIIDSNQNGVGSHTVVDKGSKIYSKNSGCGTTVNVN